MPLRSKFNQCHTVSFVHVISITVSTIATAAAMILELVCMLRNFHSECIVLLDCAGNLSRQARRNVSEMEWK